MLRWLFYSIESQTQCQKNVKAKENFKLLVISYFNVAIYQQSGREVGKNSQYFASILKDWE
jgi:hypothetical protein